jgi:hypothetical protein
MIYAPLLSDLPETLTATYSTPSAFCRFLDVAALADRALHGFVLAGG